MGLDEPLLNALKKGIEADKELKELKTSIESRLGNIEGTSQKAIFDTTRERLTGMLKTIDEGLVKSVDLATPMGQKKYSELLGAMSSLVEFEIKTRGVVGDEESRLATALRMVGLDAVTKKSADDKAKEEELAKRRQDYADNALSQEGTRKTGKTVMEMLDEVMKKHNIDDRNNN